MSGLAAKSCVPCKGGVPPLTGEQIAPLALELGPEWVVAGNHHLRREFALRNFADALAFTNRVGAIAEEQGHHPDICLGWGKVALEIWTHKVDGLTESDFILAAKLSDAWRAHASTSSA